ncbi:heavy metal-responsive transcriptional regulator [Micromonospora sp. NPDC051296]|uniref:heavy metal-responsive transcriptional regulator n=1 Tax=Micromonospora sp. NPDC051296 TaxID=3155046 RepID=UPI00342868C0
MRIGELAAASGVNAKTLRFYEEIELLPRVRRTAAGYRDYPEEILVRLRFIRTAQAAGLTLADIGGILAVRDGGHAPCTQVADLIGRHLAQVRARIAELENAERELRHLADRAEAFDPSQCSGTDICQIVMVGAQRPERRHEVRPDQRGIGSGRRTGSDSGTP